VAIAAGRKITADDLNRITRGKYTATATTAVTTVTTTVADLAGCTLSVVVPFNTTQLTIRGVFDVQSTGTTDTFLGTCTVGGASQTKEAHWTGNGRATIGQEWTVDIATAGTYTVKLRVAKIGTTDTVSVYSTHSQLIVEANGI
jgi:hypothetical protein